MIKHKYQPALWGLIKPPTNISWPILQRQKFSHTRSPQRRYDILLKMGALQKNSLICFSNWSQDFFFFYAHSVCSETMVGPFQNIKMEIIHCITEFMNAELNRALSCWPK